MRKNWKKVLSLLLAASLVLGMNSLVFAMELGVDEAPAGDVLEYDAAAEEPAAVVMAESNSDNSASGNAVSENGNAVSENVTSGKFVVSVNWTKSVTYDSRKHVEKKSLGEKGKDTVASGGKNPDMDIKVTVAYDGKILTPQKVTFKFGNNKDAYEFGKDVKAGKIAAKPKKKESPYFTVKVALNKDDKKTYKTDMKAFTKALKEAFFTFEIEKCDLSTLSANKAFENSAAKYEASKKAKVVKVPANGTPDEKTKLNGLKYSVSFNNKAGKVKYKKVALKQTKKNDKAAADKAVKDFYIVSVNVAGKKVTISANEKSKNYKGFTEVTVKDVKTAK